MCSRDIAIAAWCKGKAGEVPSLFLRYSTLYKAIMSHEKELSVGNGNVIGSRDCNTLITQYRTDGDCLCTWFACQLLTTTIYYAARLMLSANATLNGRRPTFPREFIYFCRSAVSSHGLHFIMHRSLCHKNVVDLVCETCCYDSCLRKNSNIAA